MSIKLAFRIWFLSWLELITALTGILSLGLIRTDFMMKYFILEIKVKKYLRSKKEERQDECTK